MKYFLLVILLLFVSIGIFLYSHSDSNQEIPVASPVIEPTLQSKDPREDEHYLKMQSEYKKLEKARKQLERRLARIRALAWGVKLPREKSENMMNDIRNGYELLQSKRFLAAFPSLQDIFDELARTTYVNRALDAVTIELQAARSTDNSSSMLEQSVE